MADNLDLKIVIDTLLQAKGFEEAQSGLKALTDTTNQAAGAAEKKTGKQKGLAQQLGGTRGAVADLTRVLLMNLGVTGAAGETAKAAGLSMTALGAAVNPVVLGATALIAAAAVLIPKLISWGAESRRAKEEHQKLLDAIVGGLPELESLAESIGHVSEGLERQIAATQQLAFEAQKERIEKITEEIKALREQLPIEKAILETRVDSSKVLEAFTRLERDYGRALTEQEKKEERIRLELEAKLGLRQRLQEATDRGLTLDHLEAKAAKDKAEADRAAKKALDERIKAEERLKKIREEDLRLALKLRTEKAKEEAAERKKHKDDLDKAAERILWLEREKQARREEVTEAKKDAAEKRAMLAAQAAASLSYYLSFFTQNRAVRIAQAIADTYAAATRALAEFPYPANTVIAGIMVAAGLKNVSEIRKADVGFDDPINDMLAQRLGRKFATDVLQHINAGFAGGLNDLSGRGASVVNRTTINRNVNVTANGIIGSRTGFRSWLEREMTLAERVRARKSI